MALPDANVSPQDGGLGLAAEGVQGIHTKIGLCSSGDQNVMQGFSSPEQLVETLGHGPLVNALADAFAAGARIVYAVRATVGTAGTPSAVAADGNNTGDGAVAVAGDPNDAYDVIIEILSDGVLNAATFRYSLDGGNTWSDPITVPADPGEYEIPNTNLTVTFSLTTVGFKDGDLFTFTTTAPVMSTVTAGAAVDVALAWNGQASEFLHIVGAGDSALWTAIGTKMATAVTSHKYLWALMEAPYLGSGDTKADWVADRVNESTGYADVRISVCTSWCEMVCPLTGRTLVRNQAGIISGRIAALRKVSLSPGRVREGSLPAITALKPDGLNDADILSLDAARYVTVRQYEGMSGFYITNGRMMAPSVSDYRWIEWRRVMDLACREVRQAQLGSIHDEATPAGLEALRADMQAPIDRMIAKGEIDDGKVRIPPGQDVLGTGALEAEVALVPIGAIREISTKIKFARTV